MGASSPERYAFNAHVDVSMPERLVNIRYTDRVWREAFLRYVPKVFPSVSFRRWGELGGWDESYQTFSILESGEIVASASLQRMELIVAGQRVRGWQFGAVGTLPGHRARGLQRELIPRALELAGPDDLVFLFANDLVTRFYPRFGFKLMTEYLFRAQCSVIPAREHSRVLQLDREPDRSLLARVAGQALPVTTTFGAANYGRILLWYWANYYPDAFHYIESEDAIVVAEQEEQLLRVLDVLAPHRIDLRACLSGIATSAAECIEFGFTPDIYWPGAKPAGTYTDSPLFVRGPHELPPGPFKYPLMAQT